MVGSRHGSDGDFGLVFSGSRGAVLGLIAGLGVVILGYALVLKEHPRNQKDALGGFGPGRFAFGYSVS